MIHGRMLAAALCLLGTCRIGSAQVSLQWKFPEGGQVAVETTQTSQQKFVLGGQEMDSGERRMTVVASNVGKRDTAGNLRVASRITVLKTTMTLPLGAKIDYDSTKPQTGEEADDTPFPDVYKALQASTKRTWTTVYDQSNQVLAVEGSQDVLSSLDEATAEMIRPQTDAQYMAQARATQMGRIPRDPVQPGATWSLNETTRIEGGLVITLSTTYKYEGTVQEDDQYPTLEFIDAVEVERANKDLVSPLMDHEWGLRIYAKAYESGVLKGTPVGAVLKESNLPRDAAETLKCAEALAKEFAWRADSDE